MSARGALQMFIVVLLALVCVGFMAVVGMSAAAAPANGGGDHGYDSTAYDRPDGLDHERSGSDRDRSEFEDRRTRDDASRTRVNVHTSSDVITVTNRGEQPVDVAVEALEGDYAGDGDTRLAPCDSITLPAPEEPSMIRVLAESDDARLEVLLTFETYEYTCGEFAHSQVAPASASYEFEAGGESRSRTHEFERPPFECPSPPGDGGTPTPPADGGTPTPPDDVEPPRDPESAYNETHDRVFEGYEEGNETAWSAYEAARAALWGAYEDGHSRFWQLYERVMGDDDDDDDDDGGGGPPQAVNETRDFAERVGNQTRDDAERVANDTQDNAERVANDTQGDVERIREDAEDGRDRVEEDVNEARDDLPPNDGGDDNESDGGPDVPPEPPDDVSPEPPGDIPPGDDNESDGGPEVPPEPPDDFPPEPPGDVLPEPPGDVPPGDDNESDDMDPLPDGEAVSYDADGDAGRDGDTVWAEGDVHVEIRDGTAYVGVDERLEIEGGSDA